MSFINAESVVKRLESLGAAADDRDVTSIELIINGIEEYIMNYCNISCLPSELYNAAVDMCCGAFLKTKQSLGELRSVNGEVSSVKEGDITISFNEEASGAKALGEIIEGLMDKRSELECFRKLKW